MLEDGTLTMLRNTYINKPVSDSCGTSPTTESNSLALSQMAGLWCAAPRADARAMPAAASSSQFKGPAR